MSAGKLVAEAMAGEMWFAMLFILASEDDEEGEADGEAEDDDEDGGAMMARIVG